MAHLLERPPVETGTAVWRPGRLVAEPTLSGEYRPFENVETRNGLQALVEIPLMLRALPLPRGGRVLEVGCGRGVALPVLFDHSSQTSW
jgi:cyclopropane fatty-acyl-phospholipid synthase-like methyltransferase